MTSKQRATFFSLSEQDLLLESYKEYKSIITAKCNTAAAAKSREEAWQHIADRLNAQNPMGIKRTWQQVKVKYKNIIQSAKKRVKQQKTEEERPESPEVKSVEPLALQQDGGRPMKWGIAGGSSCVEPASCLRHSYAKMTGHSVTLLQPPIIVVDPEEESSEGTEPHPEYAEPGPAGNRERNAESQEDMRSLYKRYLEQEISYRQLKMRKLEKEMQLLDKQLLDDHPGTSK